MRLLGLLATAAIPLSLGLLLFAAAGGVEPPREEPPWTPAITIDLLDRRRSVTFELEPGLNLRAVNVPHAAVPSMGWRLEVRRGVGDTLSRGNLLYHSRYFHGPYPTDFLAWIAREQHFPDVRVLPVWGTSYELRGELVASEIGLVQGIAVFTAGALKIGFRKLVSGAAGPRGRAGRGVRPPHVDGPARKPPHRSLLLQLGPAGPHGAG